MRYEDLDETSAFNEYSPGPVRADESLLRCCFHPENFDESGNLLPSIIPIDHLKVKHKMEESGCSVDRYMYSSRAHIQQKLINLAQQKPNARQSDSLVEFACHEIRHIPDGSNSQAFKILDVAFQHDRSHAAIIAAREYKDSYLRKLRNIILDIWRSKPRKTLDVFGIQPA